MKKIFAVALSSIILVLSLGIVGCGGKNNPPVDTTKYSEIEKVDPFYTDGITESYVKTEAEEESQPTFDKTSAKWIWLKNGVSKNEWVRFRKTFDLNTVPTKVTAKISAESKYFLYVNGDLVVYDGSLKRGADLFDGYYDEVDLSKYLCEGENAICALVWYWGDKDQSYSNASASKAGFIFQLQAENLNVFSDESWLAEKDEAYGSGFDEESLPNYRLPEYNISYDARKVKDENWTARNFDDSHWGNAAVVGGYGSYPWNYLWKRPIPLNKDYGVTKYKNSDDYEGTVTTGRRTFVLKVGVNVQLSPVFKINSVNEGERVTITTETTKDSQGDSVRCYYYTKKGEQTFECLNWMNGQFVVYDFPEGVTIEFLGYRQTGYDTVKTGSFSSNSEFYDRLWQMSYDTLYVTMRDNFMDCPNRERAQWMGDVTNEMEQIIYSMDENSYLLYEKALKQMTGFASGDVLPTVAPIKNAWFELPIQNLCAISGAWTYYLYTGRSAVLEGIYPYFYKYLKLWSLQSNGLVVHRAGSWDWTDNDDMGLAYVEGIENAWYYKALAAIQNFAILFDNQEVFDFAEARMKKIADGFDKYVFEEMFRCGDDRACAIAILSGLVDKKDYSRVTEILKQSTMCSPFWEKYVLEALCEAGEYDAAMRRMMKRYAPMVSETKYGEPYSTLWEKWDSSKGTQNHAWSGGPMTVLSKYVLGVKPLTSGYENILIKPALSTFTDVDGVVPTVKGDCKVSLRKNGDALKITIKTPDVTKAVLGIPFEKNQKLEINGDLVCAFGYVLKEGYEFAGMADGYIYFLTDGGDYEITVTAN